MRVTETLDRREQAVLRAALHGETSLPGLLDAHGRPWTEGFRCLSRLTDAGLLRHDGNDMLLTERGLEATCQMERPTNYVGC